MTIRAGSRYENSVVDYFRKTENGQAYPIVFYTFDTLDSISYYTHTFVKGETLTALSWKYFNRPDLWWVIAEYNPEITNFVNIEGGTVLRIPHV
jgi:nucleoid-associated protein YgaU